MNGDCKFDYKLNSQLSSEQLAQSLSQLSCDYFTIDNQSVKSLWYHSPREIDLFLWEDESSHIIKQQMTLWGQVIEWNPLNGVRTGMIIEEEIWTKEASSERVEFDLVPVGGSIKRAMEIVNHLDCIDLNQKKEILLNFSKFHRQKSRPNKVKKSSLFSKLLSYFK